MTVLGTETLVQLVNDELALLGSELAQAMAKPTGPFSSVVFGIIDGHHVQLHFLTEPATEMCGVLLASKEVEVLPGQRTGTTFEAAIQEYPWAEAVEALEAN
ncbi:hypothetical protein [Cryobacterium luteum]|uniref:hypothetical protein n=1 Tax=Cryobacterium luteum TaxID=1424661 RepID=UPI0008D4DFF3|nr:hypothetical protein [Cryobacterium luteum]SEN98845.1 hypothetical protein SAMN05216281_12315 [Cryobacterium luteum]